MHGTKGCHVFIYSGPNKEARQGNDCNGIGGFYIGSIVGPLELSPLVLF